MLVTVLKVTAVVAVVIIGLRAAGAVWQVRAEAASARRNPPPGRMVDVGGGRRLHLICKGDAPGPTVIIEQGAGAPSAFWCPVLNETAAFARVCAYDRAGLGWSDPVKGPRTMRDRVEDLDALLMAADIPGPYVLVGHSYGGPLISLYARAHPDDVAGMVFADTPDMEEMLGPDYRQVLSGQHLPMLKAFTTATRFGIVRLAGKLGASGAFVPPTLSAEAKLALTATHRRAGGEAALDDVRSILNAKDDERTPLAPGVLGDRPVAVISHDQPFPGPMAPLEKGFATGQARLAALSTDSLRLTAQNSGHQVQLDAPATVVGAIRRVHAAARDATKLNIEAPLP